MLCAVYGLLLFANTFSGLWIESLFPYIFALPILLSAMKEGPQVSLCALGAMLLLTWMLSGMSTWLIAGSMLLAGWMFGWGIHSGISIVWTSLVCLLILFGVNLLEMTVLAALFGFDPAEEQSVYRLISSWISWNGFLCALAALQAFLETFAMACLTVLIALKGSTRREILSFKLKVGISPLFFWGFCVIFPVWALAVGGMVSFPVELRDLLLIAWMICLIAMIFKGCRVLIGRLTPHAGRWQVMLVVLSAFVPGIQLIPAAVGGAALAGESIRRKRKNNETI